MGVRFTHKQRFPTQDFTLTSALSLKGEEE